MNRLLQATVTGDHAISLKLEGAVGDKAVQAILDDIAAAMLNRERTRFLQQLDPDGNKWVPSKAGQQRAAHGDGFTLFNTGRLFHSIQLFAAGPNQRAIGTDVTSPEGFPYGKALQEGAGGLVPRVFLGFGQEDIATAETIGQTRLEKLLAN